MTVSDREASLARLVKRLRNVLEQVLSAPCCYDRVSDESLLEPFVKDEAWEAVEEADNTPGCE
jgi:hypothetical protein